MLKEAESLNLVQNVTGLVVTACPMQNYFRGRNVTCYFLRISYEYNIFTSSTSHSLPYMAMQFCQSASICLQLISYLSVFLSFLCFPFHQKQQDIISQAQKAPRELETDYLACNWLFKIRHTPSFKSLKPHPHSMFLTKEPQLKIALRVQCLECGLS